MISDFIRFCVIHVLQANTVCLVWSVDLEFFNAFRHLINVPIAIIDILLITSWYFINSSEFCHCARLISKHMLHIQEDMSEVHCLQPSYELQSTRSPAAERHGFYVLYACEQ